MSSIDIRFFVFVECAVVRLEFNVTKKQWLTNPNLRWKAGLEKAGLNFRQRLQRANYPPAPPLSTYIRTGTLANKAGFSIYESGGTITMYFGSTFYLPYLLYGTPSWVGWTPYGKKEEIVEAMKLGFQTGIIGYTE